MCMMIPVLYHDFDFFQVFLSFGKGQQSLPVYEAMEYPTVPLTQDKHCSAVQLGKIFFHLVQTNQGSTFVKKCTSPTGLVALADY